MNTLFLGTIGLAFWALIWYRASRGPLGWISPTSLFALGMFVFYLAPSMYWQFRPWSYVVPPYFEGLPRVLGSAVLVSMPFLFVALLGKRRKKRVLLRLVAQREQFGDGLWLLLIPIISGMGWRLYTLSLGWQSRLARDIPTFFGSQSMAHVIENFSWYFPAAYFGLVAFGDKTQRRIGIAIWLLDGLLRLYTLHRFEILSFFLHSIVFATLLGWKLKPRYAVALVGVIVGVIALGGQSGTVAAEKISTGQAYLSVGQAVATIWTTGVRFIGGDVSFGSTSQDSNFVLRATDDAMFRFYDARSDSAVMSNVPNVLPYTKGETYLQIPYAMIPRIIWPEKPNLDDIHNVTTKVMPDDSGVNPLGTLGEFYLSYGFFTVFLGGWVSLIFCKWGERLLTRKTGIGPAVLCVYPFLAELYFFATFNFTQRMAEGIHALLVVAMMASLFWFLAKRSRAALRSVDVVGLVPQALPAPR